ncbi:MAG TPA: kelch repeat-containing protein [Verrucomicrobiae bacterium]|nr:kelch repeat-containing protein [Verrucomicrobiae bacterium]
MKTPSGSRACHRLRPVALAFVLATFAVPAARAGLTMEMDLVLDDNTYSFYPNLGTNTAAPAVPFGDYFVASPGWPTNGASALFHCDATGFNQVGSGNYGFADFDAPAFNDSFIQNITNGQWSIFVTNSVVTNVYHFSVTANISSNSMPSVAVIYPPNNALNVTNQPTFLWQGGPTNYTDLVLYQGPNNIVLPVTQTSYSGFTAAAGLDSFNVHYDLFSTNAVVNSVPTNSASSPLSSWGSTAHLQDLAESQFTVGSPAADFNADLNTTNLPWATMGDAAWFTETTNTYNGTPAAAQSGSVTGGQASTLSVIVNGPGTLTYYWSSIANDPAGGFSCEFDVDGNYSNNITGDTAWYQDGPYSIGPGQHTLSWTVFANGDTDPTEAGFLDNVSFVVASTPTLTVTASPQSGPVPLTVQFTSPAVDGNGNTVTNWNWTFGDGGSSTAQSPLHTYTNAGSYFPSLTAYSTFGSSPLSVTGPGTITVTPPPPPTGNWTDTGSIGTSERFAFPLTVLPNGEVLASGGEAVFQIATYFESDLYNPTNGTWQTTGYMNYARQYHTATLLTNGLVLAAGGLTVGSGGQTLSACELYSPATGLWTNTGSMKTARYSHTAVLLTNGFVLVAGGISNSVTLASSELYNPTAGTWTSTGNLNTPRAFASAFLLTNGTVLVVGGQGTNNATLSSAEIYNPGTGLWHYTASPMLASQYQPISQLLPDGRVLVAGGSTNGTTVTGFSELYNPVSDSWSQTGFMNTPCEAAGSVLLTNGVVLVAGGNDGNSGNYMTNAELFVPGTGIWTVTGSMKEGRSGPFPIVLLANGQALATGGIPANNDLSTGTAELYTTTVPSIRILNPTRLTGGAFQFSFTNTPGAGSTVFTTTNLGLPFANWTTLGSATEVSPGQFQFTDPQATNNSKRFYRVRSP